MSEIIQQVPTLIGVIVGALGSYLVSTVNDRLRWRREHRVRWEERRIAAYADYASAVKRIFQLTLRITAYRGIHPSARPLSPAEGMSELHVAGSDRAAKWETVLLVGTPRTVAAAREWHRTIWTLEDLASRETCDSVEFVAAVERSGRARSAFYEAARQDLGLEGDRLPEADSLLSLWLSRTVPSAHELKADPDSRPAAGPIV